MNRGHMVWVRWEFLSLQQVLFENLKITNLEVGQPRKPHPKRPISGLDWPKEEVSGTRLWGLLANEYGSAESISNRFSYSITVH